MPVKLGKGGVQEIQEWELAPDEQEGLERTAAAMAAAARIVDDVLGLRGEPGVRRRVA